MIEMKSCEDNSKSWHEAERIAVSDKAVDVITPIEKERWFIAKDIKGDDFDHYAGNEAE